VSRRHKIVVVTDLGPKIQRDRGDLVVDLVADPDAPNRTVRRAKRIWVPDTMLNKGTITGDGHAACSRYLSTHARGVHGVKETEWVPVDCLNGGVSPCDAQLDALTDFRKAERAVGKRLGEGLTWCVLGYASLDQFAEHKGVSPHQASGFLIAAVERLCDHYGY
jgi:hypothetical protein